MVDSLLMVTSQQTLVQLTFNMTAIVSGRGLTTNAGIFSPEHYIEMTPNVVVVVQNIYCSPC